MDIVKIIKETLLLFKNLEVCLNYTLFAMEIS